MRFHINNNYLLLNYRMDLQNIGYGELENIFDQIMDPGVNSEKTVVAKDVCEKCNVQKQIQDCFYVCGNCGETDLEPLFYDIPFEMNHLKRSFYKRRLYCIEKLNYIAGLKEPTSKVYRNMIAFLKKKKFTTIKKLKSLMKLHGYHKYYKYI